MTFTDCEHNTKLKRDWNRGCPYCLVATLEAEKTRLRDRVVELETALRVVARRRSEAEKAIVAFGVANAHGALGGVTFEEQPWVKAREKLYALADKIQRRAK